MEWPRASAVTQSTFDLLEAPVTTSYSSLEIQPTKWKHSKNKIVQHTQLILFLLVENFYAYTKPIARCWWTIFFPNGVTDEFQQNLWKDLGKRGAVWAFFYHKPQMKDLNHLPL